MKNDIHILIRDGKEYRHLSYSAFTNDGQWMEQGQFGFSDRDVLPSAIERSIARLRASPGQVAPSLSIHVACVATTPAFRRFLKELDELLVREAAHDGRVIGITGSANGDSGCILHVIVTTSYSLKHQRSHNGQHLLDLCKTLRSITEEERVAVRSAQAYLNKKLLRQKKAERK